MDCAKDGLALVCEFPEESDKVPCALGVQTGGRFIKEEQQFGFASQLDSDGQPFPSFYVQAEYQSLREILQLEKLDHLFDIGILFFLGNVLGLTKVS